MKNLLLLGAIAMVLVSNLTSCKKGENDPTLSLKSRKARLAGEWTVTNIVKANSHVNTAMPFTSSTTAGSYAAGILTEVTTNTTTGINQTMTQTITTTYDFKKDGTYTKTDVHATFTDVITGNWVFMGKNKNQNLKKKEAIYLYITKWVQTDNNGVSQTVSITGIDMTADVLEIDQLKSKEIILINENTNVQGSTTDSNKTTYTLTAK